MDPYQSLFNSYVQKTPDGRYFVPFSATAQYGAQRADDGGYVYQTRDFYGGNTTTSELSPQDYYNQIAPYDVAVTGGINTAGAQNALGFNLSGMPDDQVSGFGSRGDYNGQQGFFYSPQELQRLVGWNPATTGGLRPNEGGLWNALAIMAPAIGAVGSFGLDQIAASSVGTAGASSGGVVSAASSGANVAADSSAGAADAGTVNTAADTSTISGSQGSSTLSGNAAGDTLSTSGGSMDFTVDPDTGDVIPIDNSPAPQFDPVTGDQIGYQGNFQGGPGTPGSGDYFDPSMTSDPGFLDMVQKYGPQLAKTLYGYLKGTGSGLSSGLGGLFGGSSSGGPTLGSTLPGMLALAYAARQPGIDTSRLTGVYDAAGANAPLFTQAAIDPVQKNIAAGYGDLLQSQGLRGIRGSSFGTTDIANYIDTTSRTLGDVGASAAQKALGLQGDLAGQIAALQAKSQELKNNLYGRAFDVLGRGLNPRGYGGLTLNPQ